MKGAKTSNHSFKDNKKSNSNSDFLKGLSVCVSGFSNVENEEFKKKIEKLGGSYIEDLLVSTHYLIVNKINSSKAISAMKHNIKLVTKDWLDEKNEEKYLKFEKCKPGCFYGINLFLFGFNEEEINNMSKIISERGGHITEKMNESDVIIIQSNSGIIHEDLDKFKKYNNKLVTENWFNDCVSKNEFKNIEENKDLLNFEIINKNYTTIINDIELGHNDKYQNLFLGKIFAIEGFKNEIKLKIIKLISFCNGLYFEKILENTDYVIVPLTFDKSYIIQNKLNAFGMSPQIVTCNWLFDCIKKGQIFNTDFYKPIKTIDMPKETIINKKQIIVGDLFQGHTFSIVNKTYQKDKILEIKDKIEQFMGEYFDSGNVIAPADFKAKYIILNDGFPDIWNKIIQDNCYYDIGKIIISHRYIDECIRMRKIIDVSDFFDSVPYPFHVPVEEFKNRNFYLPSAQYSLQERICYERLIETFGGSVDELNKNTTHVVFKKEEISQHTKDKMINGSNKNVKCIYESYFTDYILQSGKCDINNYEIKIREKK